MSNQCILYELFEMSYYSPPYVISLFAIDKVSFTFGYAVVSILNSYHTVNI